MSEGRRTTAPALEIKGLNVYYGASHALQGVDLGLHGGVLSVVGRNGMGKTTLCKAIMGLEHASSGTISFGGQLLNGKTPAEIARLGVGYVPQGRRLWRSLTVDEHLRLVAQSGGAWTVERIYDSFPRLAERKSNGGAQLSGGEQQMLAIGRALLLNPRLLVMDEPTEGLAPVIVAHVEDMLLKLAAEGDIDVLVIEQNIGVATSVAETVAVMVNGRVSRIVPSLELATDRDLQQRLLGVGQHAHDEEPDTGAPEPDMQDGTLGLHYQAAQHALPQVTRWSGIDAAARPAWSGDTITEQGSAGIVVLGAMDRSGDEMQMACAALRGAGHKVTSVDISTRPGLVSSADVPAHRLAAWHPRGAAGIHDGRGRDPRLGVAEALARFLSAASGLKAIIGVLNLGEALTMAPALRDAAGDVPVMLVGEASARDIGGDGLGRHALVLTADGAEARYRAIRSACAALTELLVPAPVTKDVAGKGGPVALVSGLGGDALCSAVMAGLEQVVRCHPYAPTPGGMATLETALRAGEARAVIDLDQSDFADRLFGGIIETPPDRVAPLCAAKRPFISVLNGGDRIFARQAETSMMTSRPLDRAEAASVGQGYAAALNDAPGEITVIVPSELPDTPGAWFADAFTAAFHQSGQRRLIRSAGRTESRDTIQHILRALDGTGANASATRRVAAGTAYGAPAS